MHWNYRVVEHDGEFAVHEVFYGDDDSISGMTETPVYPRAESLEVLIEEIGRHQRALTHPVLPYNDETTKAPADKIQPNNDNE